MSKHLRRTLRVLSDEQTAERFDAKGKAFEESLRPVLAGGPDDGHGGESTDDGKADK